MVSAVRVSVPPEVADSLVAEGVAVRPLTTRGAATEVIQYIVDGIGVGADVVTVAVAGTSMKRISKAVAKHVRSRGGTDARTIVVRGPDGGATRTIAVDADEATIEAQVDDAAREAGVLAASEG